ncbi:hypothetical protein ACNKHT_13685 [Shigella flexneri]
MKGLLSCSLFFDGFFLHMPELLSTDAHYLPAENKEVMVQLMNQWKPFFAAAGVD